MKNILQIDEFGSIDAENDSQLIDCFYRAKVIDDLLAGKKSIVIGRKGTGKTALYKYICNEHKDEAIPLDFKDYPWKIHDNFVNSVVSEREQFVNSWTFLFLLEIAKRLVGDKNALWDKPEKKIIRKLKKWLQRNWGSINFDYRENLSPKSSKFSWSFNPQILGNGLGSISKDFSNSSEKGAVISEYNKKLETLISSLLQSYKAKIFLAFDQLDLAYSYSDENYTGKLIGLLLTAYSFYNKYPNVKIFVFLRSDIFSAIDFQDKNKIKDNLVTFLDWNGSQENSILSLKKLISRRIENTLGTGTNSFEFNWNYVFEENKIGKNQFKWNFMLERTFIRPRDIIKFMNLSLQQAKQRIYEEKTPNAKITNVDINSIRQEYSRYLYEELKDEMNSKYPNYNDYLEILRSIHTVFFTREEFDKCYKTIRNKKKLKESVEEVMERLYEFSIIGFYKPGGGGYGGSSYMFQYNSDYQAFNTTASKYQVHFGFKEHLELIEKR